MKRLSTLLLSAILFTSACLGQAQAVGLDGRTFLSTAVTDGAAAKVLAPETRIRLVFNADGSLGASAGCNSIGGTYRVVDGVLDVEPGAMTEMGCDEARHAQDAWLIEFLASDPRIVLSGNDLGLSSGTTAIRLLDREVAEPDLPLAGTQWVVDSIIEGEAVSSVPDGARATLRIAEDGSAVIQTGCNEGGGRVVLDGAQIRFTDLVSTDMACVDGRADLERAVMAVLNAESATWTIDAGRLTITAGGAGLSFQGS
jgi:heat shock protein HslJ